MKRSENNWVRVLIPLGERPETVLSELERAVGAAFAQARETPGGLLIRCENEAQKNCLISFNGRTMGKGVLNITKNIRTLTSDDVFKLIREKLQAELFADTMRRTYGGFYPGGGHGAAWR